MLLFLSVLIAVSALAVFVAGLLALLRNPRKAQNRWFFTFSTFLALWIPANFIDSNIVKPFWTDIFLRLDFGIALFIAWSLMEFVNVFTVGADKVTQEKLYRPLIRYSTFALNMVFLILALSGNLVSSSINSGELKVTYGAMFGVYAAVLLFYFAYALGHLYIKRRHAHQEERPALNLIFNGLIVAVVANILTNLLFPIIVTNRTTIKALNTLGYLGFLVFVIFTYLAITTQKLFDIRLIVARSIAYILSLASMAALFIGVTFTVSDVIFGNNLNSTTTRWIYTLLAIILAFIFPPLKRFFDKTTNKFFYRDAYDPQLFIDELNKILVGNINLMPLLTSSAKLIEDTIKAEYCYFDIHGETEKAERIIGTQKTEVNKQDLKFVTESASHVNQKLIVADRLEGQHIKLSEILTQNDIAIVARLVVSVNQRSNQNYLVLGNKKSGNPYNKQDIRILEIIVNELVIAIQNALRFEEIQQFNITLQQKVDDATKQLRRTNEKLKQLDETKDEFISMASHQLRTPLTSMKGYVSMVLEGDSGKITGMQRKLLDQAFVSSQRMVYLIADLLNVSRLRTGKFIIENKPTNLAEVVDTEISQLIETAKGRDLELTYNKPKEFPTLMLDETKMRQVIMNFADNAIYYTPAGGHIQVNLVDKGDTIEYTVVDDGLGVPRAEQHHLFTKFFRAGNARKARPDGTGLGLFMAKKVIATQGGAIVFKSEEGKGSTFGFSFAKSALQPVPKQTAPPKDKKAAK